MVVGVVGDVKQSLIGARADAVYVPELQWRFAERAMWVVLRTSVDPVSVEPAVRRAIRAIDQDQPILRVATLEQRVATSMARQRFVMLAFDAFAAIALLLAIVGVYGILSGGVVERTREIAVRSAVGATRAGIIGLVVRQAGGIAAAGMTVGFAAAVAGSRALTALLFEISPLDTMTYVAVGAMLLVAIVAGALIPAWRAARVSPSVALQSG
jgi:putative ABC transport system permease protein